MVQKLLKRGLIAPLVLVLILFWAEPLGAQPRYENRFVRPLAELLAELEQRFGVRLECRKFSADTLNLTYADFRVRPYSLEASLDGICRPLDLKWSKRSEGRYRLEPYEYYRRTVAEGEALLTWLSGQYEDRAAWELRRARLLTEAREVLNMKPLYDSLVAEPRVTLGPVCKMDGYTTQNYRLETLPGIFVDGTIYAPRGRGGRRALVINLAGHWPEGRLGRDQQLRMATLARMGAVAVDLDIVGWGSSAWSVPFDHEDGRSMRLQALWSKAVTDWVIFTRKDIDTDRMAVTGGSGGATHTLLLALQDDRFRVLAPVVHLVSHFDGGCPCESAEPITLVGGGSCTTELLAAVAAPKPLLVVSDGGDWTASYPELEYPFLRRIWSFYNAETKIENCHLEGERHDFGVNKRMALYRFLARELGIDLERADEERVTVQESEALQMPIPM